MSARPGRPGPAALNDERTIALPDDVVWRRVHVITPLLEGWKGITVAFTVVVLHNFDNVMNAYRALKDNGWSLTHDSVRWTVVGGLVFLVALVAWLFASWWAKSYAVDRNAVYLRSGLVIKRLRTARLPRIQSVEVVHPLLGRVFGLGRLTVEVAGGGDSRVVIGYLPTRALTALRDQILDLAAGASTAAPQGAHRPGGADLAGPPAPGALASPAAPAPGPAPAAPHAVGFEDMTVDPARAGRREERALYTVEPGLLIGSIVRSSAVIWTIVIGIAATVGAVMIFLEERAGAAGVSLAALLPLFLTPVSLASVVWSRFNKGWNFRALATPAGIRLRYGLSTDTSATLPPGRVHAVSISQSLLWRRKDWWAVAVTVAGRSDSDSGNAQSTDVLDASVLLPAGDRDMALRALWLVTPDLGVADPDTVLDSALTGMDDSGVGDTSAPVGSPARGFIRISPRGRLFTPVAWRREAVMLTATAVILRQGRFSRRATVVPYERIQSLSVHQGPLARWRGLASVHLEMVERRIFTRIANLSLADAAELEREISYRSLRRSHTEQLDRWLERVVA